ncbi:MAG: adenylate/guanylate cyclase domain-containing protein [Spirochaetales bacterium]|nr:adenylate/guanylate cyclase domain-containing protein [Leptospiraceae bacterium]MCP5483651.1 adenylate/guanylate cyclase domain-containing protein [Spirochaetales bacterium]MCP5484484.1 adenylate/guanylate cyclase domain-containing protein [Spirochaetales bacterium]
MAHRFWRNLQYVVLFTILGAVLGVLVAYSQVGQTAAAREWIRDGATDGLLIGLLVASYVFFFERWLLKSFLRRFQFVALVAYNSVAYVVLIFIGRTIGRFVTGTYDDAASILEDRWLFDSLLWAFVAVVPVNFVLKIIDLIGARELARFLSGRYHQPRVERRVFCFMDLVGSTGIAERIGDILYLAFVDQFLHDITEAVLASRGEVHKYVGDEVILSWPARRIESVPAPLIFLKDVRLRLLQEESNYRERFDALPEFRAGLHIGEVVAGEMGDLRKEIVYLGDLMNTTARLVEACKEAGSNVVISDELLSRLSLPPGMSARPLGSLALRGRQSELVLHALSLSETG